MEIEEVLYDHYKETCDIMRQEVNKRWHLTLAIIAIMLLLSLLIVDETEGIGLITGYLKNQYGDDIIIKFKYINTAVIYTYLIIVMAYYQMNIRIERLYGYIHKTEEKLNQQSDFGVTREGADY